MKFALPCDKLVLWTDYCHLFSDAPFHCSLPSPCSQSDQASVPLSLSHCNSQTCMYKLRMNGTVVEEILMLVSWRVAGMCSSNHNKDVFFPVYMGRYVYLLALWVLLLLSGVWYTSLRQCLSGSSSGISNIHIPFVKVRIHLDTLVNTNHICIACILTWT